MPSDDILESMREAIGRSTTPPLTQSSVNHLALTFEGNLNQMFNKIYEYVKQLHAEQFPDHQDHQEAP